MKCGYYYICSMCGNAIKVDHVRDIERRATGLCKDCYNNKQMVNWKGDDVSYRVLHKYIRRHKPKPATCEICNKKGSLEIANINKDRIYSRNIDDYMWLCHKCHMKLDYDEIKRKRDKHGRYKKVK